MALLPIEQNGKTVYKCECCDKIYDSLPLCIGYDKPSIYFSIPEEEREQRIRLDKSWCVVDEEHFFHRGNLVIPIIDSEESLEFGVWTSISADNFKKRMDLWDNPARANEEPYFGWLSSNIAGYDDTLNIKTIAQENEDIDAIPNIYVIEEDHPLAIDQENGITMDKALDILSIVVKH